MRLLFVIAAVSGLAWASEATAQEPPPGAGTAKAATTVGKEPPAAKGPATAKGSLPANDSGSTRVDGNKLKQELSEVEKQIKYAEEKMSLGHQASKAWNETSERVKSLIESHNQQAAACESAKLDLKRRADLGTPEAFLKDAKRHVDKCDEARKRYRGMIAAIETDVTKMLEEVTHITGNVEQLKTQQTEQLRRKSVLDQLISTGLNSVKGKIDAFTNYQGH